MNGKIIKLIIKIIILLKLTHFVIMYGNILYLNKIFFVYFLYNCKTKKICTIEDGGLDIVDSESFQCKFDCLVFKIKQQFLT